jgi:hypothetical protein
MEIEYGHVSVGICAASVLLKWQESGMEQVLYEKFAKNHYYYGLTVM